MLPSPLHPALVHFPIALLIFGAPLAVVSVFTRRWHLPLFAALVLLGGAGGAFVAVWTGGDAAENAGGLDDNVEAVLQAHSDWADLARNAGIAAAFFAILSLVLSKKKAAQRVIAALSALASLTAAFSVAQAGHAGGKLVYQYGVGLDLKPAESTEPSPTPSPADNDEKAR